MWLPDDSQLASTQESIEPITATRDAPVFDAVLASLDRRYGRSTARGVAIDFEYP